MRRNVNQAPEPSTECRAFWVEQIRSLGRKTFFVDTGAVLDCFTPGSQKVHEFLNGLVGDTLVTSPYVVVESVRRLIKAEGGRFSGPGGQVAGELASHFLREWLREHNVMIIWIPPCVFEGCRSSFHRHQGLGCDLTDIVSYEIVKGLEQERILALDTHFKQLGLTCYP